VTHTMSRHWFRDVSDIHRAYGYTMDCPSANKKMDGSTDPSIDRSINERSCANLTHESQRVRSRSLGSPFTSLNHEYVSLFLFSLSLSLASFMTRESHKTATRTVALAWHARRVFPRRQDPKRVKTQKENRYIAIHRA